MKCAQGLIRGAVVALFAAACSPEAERATTPAGETPRQAQTEPDPAAYRGAAVAGQVCAQCHDVGMGAAAAVNIGAPDFKVIAGRPESTPEGLAAWMLASHPKMPNYLFSEAEVTDLAAYIISLRAP